MSRLDLSELRQHPHRRFNPLLREWVLVSSHQTERPWEGQADKVALDSIPAFDPTFYLCPGNERVGGIKSPPYVTIFVFDNDFAALLSSTPPIHEDVSGLLVARSKRGICCVVCFSPQHELALPTMHEGLRRAKQKQSGKDERP